MIWEVSVSDTSAVAQLSGPTLATARYVVAPLMGSVIVTLTAMVISVVGPPCKWRVSLSFLKNFRTATHTSKMAMAVSRTPNCRSTMWLPGMKAVTSS